jgi:Protein of unknown function (DUF2777)
MNPQQRMRFIEHQSRAFLMGTIEIINDQWVFFDEETDEAMMLDEYLHQEIEVFRHHKWFKGILVEDGHIQLFNETVFLMDQMNLRIRKKLIYSLELLLDELSDDTFIYFLQNLNALDFSIYDCIYCYNHLSFLPTEGKREGVNLLIFDNGEKICAVHHHFTYPQPSKERFEYTLNCGKRIVVEKMNP